MEPKRPDATGIALLQALHVLHEMENYEIRALENDMEWRNINPVEGYPWGLFKTTLLKATKNRQDLKDWSPHQFADHKECHHCNGEGKNPIPTDSPRYREYLADHQRTEELIANGTYERTSLDTPFNDGDPLWSHCSPCQGSGVLTKFDQVWETKNPRKKQA